MFGILGAVGTLVVIVLLRLMVRRVWIADLLWSAMFGIVVSGPFIYPAAADHVFAALLMPLALLAGGTGLPGEAS
jgi:hypothetical protein